MLSGVKRLAVAAVAAVILGGLFAWPAHAVLYGTGNYGHGCTYGCVAASSATQQTNVTLPSGLKVTINLKNGQKIPASGYTVVVQPEDNQTLSIKSVDFYLNNAWQYTGTPNAIGAVRWLWLPTPTTGDITIKIVITGSDGSANTQQFTVSIGTPETPQVTAAPTSQAPTDAVGTISHAVINFVAALPKPVIYGVPYFLFALLAANILLLLWQAQRELREIAALQKIIDYERRNGVEKNAFVSLASHYLRTPLSIIDGGLDMARVSASLPADIMQKARGIVDSLRTKVDALLTQTETNVESSVATPHPLPSPWKDPGLYVPVLLVGIFAFVFNYIAARIESFSIGQMNLFLQIVAYALLATMLYQSFRRRQLRRRDTRAMQTALAHEQAINQQRDAFIAQSADMLGGDIEILRSVFSAAPANQATQFVQDGIKRFFSVLVKFAIAGQLRSGQRKGTAVSATLSDIMASLPQSLKANANRKEVQLLVQGDTPFATTNPQLVGYMLASLIDNAIEYSPNGASIDVRADAGQDGVIISVTDHGSGVDAQKLSMLFRPFMQTQDVERFTHEGMGFSLYLDKLIATYLGGTISITSKPGVATTATIALPAAV